MHKNLCQFFRRISRLTTRKFHCEIGAIIAVLAVVVSFGPLAVFAAPLTYTSNTTVSLTSPAATFTIVASSTADTLVVNASSVVVTISSSTGGSFSLTSASRDLSIASSSSGGTVTQSCTSGVASTTISQSTGSSSYTITPTASACAITISSVNSSVSGNSATITWTTNFPSDSTVSYGTTVSYGSTASGSSGVTSHSVSLSSLSYSTTYHYSVSSAAGTTSATSSDATFTTPAAPSTSSGGGGGGAAILFGCLDPKSPNYNPSANFNVVSLCMASSTTQRSAAISSTSTPTPSIQPVIGQVATPTPTTFSRNLRLGSKGDDVKSLQLFLIGQNTGPISRKLAAVGANGRFGPLTKKALSEYQWSIGIRPASGYFGLKTRNYINSLKR